MAFNPGTTPRGYSFLVAGISRHYQPDVDLDGHGSSAGLAESDYVGLWQRGIERDLGAGNGHRLQLYGRRGYHGDSAYGLYGAYATVVSPSCAGLATNKSCSGGFWPRQHAWA